MAQYVYTMRRVQKIVPPKREILKNISLNFFPGAKIGVLGLNGSGKSSLLRIMAGEDQNYEGEVIRMPNIKVGYLPQEPALDAHKTVRETVEESQQDLAGAKQMAGVATGIFLQVILVVLFCQIELFKWL
jgi:ATPase subunit of ABC transporter with duplicated ATPase domains